MATASLGDLAQSYMLRRQMGQARTLLAQATQEMTTGQTTDIVRQAQGNLGPLAAIDTSLARLDVLKTTTGEAELWSGMMQSALQAIDDRVTGLVPDLLSSTMPQQGAAQQAVSADAEAAFRAAVSSLNLTVDGRALFGGTGTDRAPLPDADSLMSAIEPQVAGLATVEEVAQQLDDWFALGGGFDTDAYQGGDRRAPVMIAPGESVALTPLATDLRDTLKGLALAALVARGIPSDAVATTGAMLNRAGQILLDAGRDRTELSAGLGMAEARIADAQVRNNAETTALQIARNRVVAVDPYEAATRLQEAETRMQMIYTVTARLSGLSLVNYLR